MVQWCSGCSVWHYVRFVMCACNFSPHTCNAVLFDVIRLVDELLFNCSALAQATAVWFDGALTTLYCVRAVTAKSVYAFPYSTLSSSCYLTMRWVSCLCSCSLPHGLYHCITLILTQNLKYFSVCQYVLCRAWCRCSLSWTRAVIVVLCVVLVNITRRSYDNTGFHRHVALIFVTLLRRYRHVLIALPFPFPCDKNSTFHRRHWAWSKDTIQRAWFGERRPDA